MEQEEIFHDCIIGTLPEGQGMAPEKRRTSFTTEEDVAKYGTIDPIQTKSEMAYESSAGFSLRAGAEDYDGDIDSDRNSSINKSGDAGLEKDTKQPKLCSLIEKPKRLNTSPSVSDGACRDDEVPQEQQGVSDSARFMTVSRVLELTEGPEEQNPQPGSRWVQIPKPENSANPNPFRPQYYSPPLRSEDGGGSPTKISSRPKPYLGSISPKSSSSSSFVNLNDYAFMEGPNRKALEKLTDDQQVATANKNIDEAKQFLIEVNSTKDERSNALTLMTDWNDVKANAQQRQTRAVTADVALHKHEGLAEPHKLEFPEFESAPKQQKETGKSINSKGRRRLRKKVSGFFRKAPTPNEAKVTSKSALSIMVPMLKADNRRNPAEPHSRINMVDTTDVNADTIPDESTATVSVSESESTSDYSEAKKGDDDAPPMPIMPTRLAETETPEVKRNYRNIHVIGSSPDHTVIIDNTNAYFSPNRRHHQQSVKTKDVASTRSSHEHCATTSDMAGKCSVILFDSELISEQAKNSAIDNDDHPPTPTPKRHPKISNASGKRSKSRSILKKGERPAEVDENDVVTPTQQSFDASVYSGDEESVHTAKGVHMTYRNATVVDIPARHGNRFPVTINKDDPHNMALFSHPPDKNMIRVEIEAEAKAAQRAHVADDEAMAKHQEHVPGELKTKRALTNLKNAYKPKEAEVDELDEEGRSEHKKEGEGYRREEDKDEEGSEDKEKEGGGGGGNGWNGTARARMEGY